MTSKTVIFDATGKPHKPEGWFSWRHPKREAHDAARDRYLAEHGPEARRLKAAQRLSRAIDVRLWECGHVATSANHPCEATR